MKAPDDLNSDEFLDWIQIEDIQGTRRELIDISTRLKEVEKYINMQKGGTKAVFYFLAGITGVTSFVYTVYSFIQSFLKG